MAAVFTFHTDSGHGWLQVPRRLLVELGILGEITDFSYQDGDSVFLEEDCDAGTFMDAYRRVYGRRPFCEDRYAEPSPVRRLPAFVAVSQAV
jgi:hypothetical protein